MDGVIVVDKPSGWSSHDVVNRMRRLAGTRRVGHLGTLDPMATGVLPLVIGRATRLAQFFMPATKAYEATILFGFATTTYDSQGEAVSTPVPVTLDREWLERQVQSFIGKIEQVPPPVSAKKINGVPAYKLARKQIEVKLNPVPVEIYRIELGQVQGASAELRVDCSGGTYVRSIAHDLGQALGYGAHLSALRRTFSSGFGLESARTLEQLGELAEQGRLAEALIPSADLLPQFPTQMVDGSTAGFIRQGRDFRVSPFRTQPDARYVKAVDSNGNLVAIGESRLPNVYHPILVL